MKLIDMDAHDCWACIHAHSGDGECDLGIFGCDSGERFEMDPCLKRSQCAGGPHIIYDTECREHVDVTSKAELHAKLCMQLHDMYVLKNHDYGDSFSQTFAEEGLTAARIRLTDKLNRFKMLSRSEQLVADESIIDTLMDLANYALLTVVELKGKQDGS